MLGKQFVSEDFSNIYEYSRVDYLYLKICEFIDINNFVEVSGKDYYNFLCDLLKGLVLNAKETKFKVRNNNKNILQNINKANVEKKYLAIRIVLISLCFIFFAFVPIIVSFIFNNNDIIRSSVLIVELFAVVAGGIIKFYKYPKKL